MKSKFFQVVLIFMIISLSIYPSLKAEGKSTSQASSRSSEIEWLPGKNANMKAPVSDHHDRNSATLQSGDRIIQSMSGYEGINVPLSSLNNQPGTMTVSGPLAIVSRMFAPHYDGDSVLILINLGSSLANLAIDFYNPDGAVAFSFFTMLAVHASIAYPKQSFGGLPPTFDGGLVISSDQPLAGIVNQKKTGTNSLLSYNLGPIGAMKTYLPDVARNASGRNTKIWLQNAGSAPATISIDYRQSTSGTIYVQDDVINPGASHGYDQATMTQLGESFSGFAVVTSTQPLYGIVEEWFAIGGKADAYEGLFSPSLSALSPWQQKQVESISSGTLILNPSTDANTITASYFDEAATPVSSQPIVLPGMNSLSQSILSNGLIPAGFTGYLQIDAPSAIVAISTLVGLETNDQDRLAIFQGLNPNSSTNNVVFPVAEKVEASGTTTRFSLDNNSPFAAEVTVNFRNQDGSLKTSFVHSIPAHGVYRFSTEDVPELGADWRGSAWVNSDQLILGEALQVVEANPVPTLDSINPTSKYAGDPAFTLEVAGTNFIDGVTQVHWNGSLRSTTCSSSTSCTASILASDIATDGTASVTVFNPEPGGGTSESKDFSIMPISTVALSLEVPATVNLGQNFYMIIQVEAGAQLVDSVAAYVDFDPALLEVVYISPGNALPSIIENSFDNVLGQINFSAGASSDPVSGTFPLAMVTFHALAPTEGTPLIFIYKDQRMSGATYGGHSIPISTRGAAVKILDSAGIQGSVSLQGRPPVPDPSWSIRLEVSLTIPGNSLPAYSFITGTDNGGHFELSGITPGTYEIRVKNSHTLDNVKVVELKTGSNSIDFGTLREGDANDDDYVSLVDFSILVSTFGRCYSDAGYDERANFNMDECVNLSDAALLADNYGLGGDKPYLIPTGMPAGSNFAQGDVNVLVVPPSSPLLVGDTFTVTIQVQAAAQPVDGVQVSLDFDPARLRVKQVTPATSFLPTVLENNYDNILGTLDYAAGNLYSYPFGTFDFIQVQFEALAETDATPLAFHDILPRKTETTFGGASVLGNLNGGAVTIVPVKVYIPVTRK